MAQLVTINDFILALKIGDNMKTREEGEGRSPGYVDPTPMHVMRSIRPRSEGSHYMKSSIYTAIRSLKIGIASNEKCSNTQRLTRLQT